ncbi:hypothetical protein QWZ06_11575 [Chryseobacterium tructae]|uniref:DUF4402 domain-containing protein n=1 Tax=Chryseobacterium tructae TaxID=1037380 RepID=A0ABV7XWF4_9FLAO|nr:hypothetical protein [Chryseobacterium tructae]MDN3692874.1 hypothetical protein [Chryseobacterium tructae]
MKIYFLMTTLLSLSAYSQIGVNTTTPTKSLDVNGELRVRILPNQSAPNVTKLITSDTNGNIQETTPLDAMYSSGLITKGHMTWNNILVGAKSARLDFTGRVAANLTNFTCSLFYQIGSGFTVLSSSSNVVVAANNATSFRITSGGTTYILTFSVNSNGYANVTSNTDWVQGTFFSIPNIN